MSNKLEQISKEILEKLKKQEIFKSVSDAQLAEAFSKYEEVHLLKGELAFRKGERYHKGIYFLYRGQVALKRPHSEFKIVCEGEPVGLSTFLGKTMYTMDAVAECDCDLIFVHELCIYNLMDISEQFREKLIKDIKMRLHKLENLDAFQMSSAFQTVASCMSSPIITLQSGKSVMEAAELMKNHRVGSVLIVNRKQTIKGLITERQIVARFMTDIENNIKNPEVENYMDKDPLVFPPEYPVVEAMNELQASAATHAVVVRNSKPVGLISKRDISVKLFENPSLYNAPLGRKSTIPELKLVYKNIYKAAQILATSSRISREELTAISSIHEAIQRKAFRITAEEFIKKHSFNIIEHEYAYLILGSAARHEMDLSPYVNHAIILSDDVSDDVFKRFVEFAQVYNANLKEIGYNFDLLDDIEPDLGLIKRYSDWIDFIDHWTSKETDEERSCFSCIMDMTIFDGDTLIASKVRSHMMKKVADKPSIIAKILKLYPPMRIPVSQFGSFIVEKNGDYKDMFNLQTQALFYLINVTRLLSLYAGINDIGTVDRIEHLARINIIPIDVAKKAIVAFDTIVETLINEQINQASNGIEISGYINPSSLSLFYQETLKRALQFLTVYCNFGINLLKQL